VTEELFRQDAYLKTATAQVRAATQAGIVLDRTIFYPMGGGQPGDTGTLVRADGTRIAIADTRKGEAGNGEAGILHIPADGQALPDTGEAVTLEIDWARRHRHMRMHSALHLLCAVVPAGVTGGQIGAERSRLDFDPGEVVFDKAAIEIGLNRLIEQDAPIAARWVEESELDARPELVRTMSVQPPRGAGRVRLLDIAGVDLQPCGGTHVARTGEIGPIVVEKIESKGKRNRRVVLALA